jgi:hypothetical protein
MDFDKCSFALFEHDIQENKCTSKFICVNGLVYNNVMTNCITTWRCELEKDLVSGHVLIQFSLLTSYTCDLLHAYNNLQVWLPIIHDLPSNLNMVGRSWVGSS